MPQGPRYRIHSPLSPAKSPDFERYHQDTPVQESIDAAVPSKSTYLDCPPANDASAASTTEDDQDGASAVDLIIAKADSLASKLRLEEQARIKAENEVRKLNSKLKTLQSRYERTADRLDKMMSQSRGFVTVTDEELKSKAEVLRYTIRNFAIEYFSGPRQQHHHHHHTDASHHRRSKRNEPKEPYETFMPHHYDLYFYKPEGGPIVVQNFLWAVLKFKVFDRFRWAENVSSCLNELWYRLAIKKTPGSHRSPDAIRKWQMWRASTTELVLDYLGEMEISGYTEKKKDEIIDEIRKVLDPFSSSQDNAYSEALSNILLAAISLDKTISTQVARIYWAFREKTDKEHHSEEHHHRPSHAEGIVVVCPAMLKRGKSNGEEFDIETVLLPKVEAVCKLD